MTVVGVKDQAVLVEFMCELYLQSIAPRGPSDVTLYEFMTYLRAQVDPKEQPRYEAAVARQRRLGELVERAGVQLAQSAELLALLAELRAWTRRPRDDDLVDEEPASG